MKKQTRNLCIAAAVFVVLGGCYIALSGREPAEETVAVGQIADLDVTDLTYSNAAGSWQFTKQDGAWLYAADAACPIDSEAVQTFVESVQALTADRALDTPDEDAVYGLDAPDYTVALSDGTDAVTLTASLADTTTYLKTTEADTVYATALSLPTELDYGLNDWIAFDDIPYATEDSLTEIVWKDTTVTRVLTENDDEDTEDADAEETEAVTTWQITDSAGTRTVEQDSTMDSFLSAARNLYALSCADYGVTTAERKQAYGLDQPDTLRVTYTTDDGTATYTVAIGASNGTGGYYAMLDDNGIVLELEAEGVDSLRAVSLTAV